MVHYSTWTIFLYCVQSIVPIEPSHGIYLPVEDGHTQCTPTGQHRLRGDPLLLLQVKSLNRSKNGFVKL